MFTNSGSDPAIEEKPAKSQTSNRLASSFVRVLSAYTIAINAKTKKPVIQNTVQYIVLMRKGSRRICICIFMPYNVISELIVIFVQRTNVKCQTAKISMSYKDHV